MMIYLHMPCHTHMFCQFCFCWNTPNILPNTMIEDVESKWFSPLQRLVFGPTGSRHASRVPPCRCRNAFLRRWHVPLWRAASALQQRRPNAAPG